MLCPRCQQPTRVIDTRVRGPLVRRVRICGNVKNGKLVTPTCTLRFATTEIPVGWTRQVSVRMTEHGLDVDVVKKEQR